MQKSKSFSLLELASHKIIMEEEEIAMKWYDKYGKNIYELSSHTSIIVYLKEINANHQRDISILKKKIQTLQYSSNMLKKTLQIQSSLFSQQVMLKYSTAISNFLIAAYFLHQTYIQGDTLLCVQWPLPV